MTRKKQDLKVVIVLTAEQVEDLKAQHLSAKNEGGESGMHIGQIFLYKDGTGCIACGVVESERAKQIQAVMGSKGVVNNRTHKKLRAIMDEQAEFKRVSADIQSPVRVRS